MFPNPPVVWINFPFARKLFADSTRRLFVRRPRPFLGYYPNCFRVEDQTVSGCLIISNNVTVEALCITYMPLMIRLSIHQDSARLWQDWKLLPRFQEGTLCCANETICKDFHNCPPPNRKLTRVRIFASINTAVEISTNFKPLTLKATWQIEWTCSFMCTIFLP